MRRCVLTAFIVFDPMSGRGTQVRRFASHWALESVSHWALEAHGFISASAPRVRIVQLLQIINSSQRDIITAVLRSNVSESKHQRLFVLYNAKRVE